MRQNRDFFQWDNDKSEETAIFRALTWGDIKTVLKKHDKLTLKKIFLRYYFKFDKRNQNFWKIILEINENEINKRANREFKNNS